jgi:SAM-dependent methyltransferase
VIGLYDQIGHGYAAQRVPDPRIYCQLRSCLEGHSSIINVGAGTGSYEPKDLFVIAVEPSAKMIAQRLDRANTVQAKAEALPFRDDSTDAVTAILSIHHWKDKKKGLEECARVARNQITLLTWDPESEGFWLVQEYFPEILVLDRDIFPTIDEIKVVLGKATVERIPIPANCVDGFLGAYWKRPHAYLDARVRSGMSPFSRIAEVEPRIEALRKDIDAGKWRQRHRALLLKGTLDIGYRLVTVALQ